MKITNFQLNLVKVIFAIFLIFIPWVFADYSDSVSTKILVQEDLTYYEIHPCKLSVSEFLLTEYKSIYQDHFHFRFNNSSSIGCFGKISGVTLLNNEFYISIGTNPLINLLIISFLWTTLFSFIKKDKNQIKLHIFKKNIAIFFTACFFAFSIYAEQRFYDNNNYELQFNQRVTYFYFLSILLLTVYSFINVVIPRINKLIILIPFSYIFIGNVSGFNFSLLSTIVVFYGIYSFLVNNVNWKLNKILFLFSFAWILNTSNRYYFDPNKLRGFTSSIYEFNSSIFWSFFFIFILNGLVFLYKNSIKEFSYDKFLKNLQISSILLLLFGFLGANFPIINFFNYFYFGQQKYGIDQNNPFGINEFSEKIAWRGFYPSAETAGEFYGLALLLTIYSIIKNKNFSFFNFLILFSSTFGIYFSNNRAVMGILFLFILYLLFTEYFNISKRIVLFSLPVIFLLIILSLAQSNLGYSYDFMSRNILIFAKKYQYDSIQSSFSMLIESSFSQENMFSKLFGLFSVLSFLLNRSEMWGLFFARYNPTFFEILFGTGPFNYGQLYGEILINNTRSFLLPHSSLLSSLLFFGIVGFFIVIVYVIIKYVALRYKITPLSKFTLLYLFVNFIKNDILSYFPTFLFYSFLIFLILTKEKVKNFKI